MTPSGDNRADKSLGEIVGEVSEKASLLVREEIELAKTEVITKAKTLARGAGVGLAAGVFLVFAAFMLLFTLAFLFNEILGTVVWVGFAIVTALMLVLGAIAGLLAKKWLSSGAPTPDAAIEEAKITRQTFEQQNVQRDQLQRPSASKAEESS
jgi:uncharacterized membrane protein YqjE